MSITFAAAKPDDERGHPMPLFACNCVERWLAECDKADVDGAEWPESYSCDNCRYEVNLSNTNAIELLCWLGIDPDYCGEVSARDLAARCRRRLWDEARNHDPALSPAERAERLGLDPSNNRVITPGREAGYLRTRTERLLKLAEKAADHLITWA